MTIWENDLIHNIIYLIFTYLYIALIYGIIHQVTTIRMLNTSRARSKKNVSPKEYFFYKNTSIFKKFITSQCMFLLSPFMLIFIFIMKINYENLLDKLYIPGFDVYIAIAISIFAGFFVSAPFFYFNSFQEMKLKDKNAVKILKIIAQCCFIEKKVENNIRKNARCYVSNHAIPNSRNAECHSLDEDNMTPQNFCRCCKWSASSVICNSNQYFMRITKILTYNLNLAYSMAALNKPSLMGFIEYMQTSVLKFELMLKQNQSLDIEYLSNFNNVDSYFLTGEINETLKLKDMDFFRDIGEINKIYKTFDVDSMIYAIP